MTSRAGAGLDAVLADGLAELVNAALSLDPTSLARLSGLEGRRAQISAELPEPLGQRHLGVTIEAGRLRLFSRQIDEPNVIIRGSPADLSAWLFGRDTGAGSGLVIDGDPTVAQELTGLFGAFRPDLAGPLERLLGRDAADSVLGSAELAFATLRSTLEGVGQAVRQGSGQAFVDRSLARRYFDELDDLRLRIDRLTARVEAEERRRAAS